MCTGTGTGDGGHGGAVEMEPRRPEGTKLTKNDGRWKSSVVVLAVAVLELLPLKFSSWLDLARSSSPSTAPTWVSASIMASATTTTSDIVPLLLPLYASLAPVTFGALS